jgi:hypothetical protein
METNDTKEEMFRIEIRFDFFGTKEDAEREAARIAANLQGGEVTAIFDENFEEV